MNTRFILLASAALLLPLVAHAQDPRFLQPQLPPGRGGADAVEPFAPPTTPGAPPPSAAEVRKVSATVLKKLKGIVFVTDRAAIQEGGIEAAGLDVSATPQLQDTTLEAKLRTFIGQPASLATLEMIRSIASTHLAQSRHPFTSILLPPQDITAGTVQFLVVEGRFGQVTVNGAKHFTEEQYKAPIRFRTGDRLDRDRLEQDVEWINRNPFREARVSAKQGAEYGTTDLQLDVQDQTPVRVYAGYNDNGTESTDYERLELGVNWGNAFGLGHLLNYQFSASPDLEKLRGQSASYIIDLPWHHSLTLSGSYSTIEAQVPQPLDSAGSTLTAGLRYGIELPRLGALRHTVILGFDFKQARNALFFDTLPVTDFLTDITEFSLGYEASLADRWGSTTLSATVFANAAGLTDHSSARDYAAARPGAEPDFVYGTLTLTRRQPLPGNWSVDLSLAGQLSNSNLLGTEQLVLGGATAVRGFSVGDYYADEGVLARVELFAPPFAVLPHLLPSREQTIEVDGKTVTQPAGPVWQDQLRLLAFYDLGVGGPHDPLPGERGSRTLQSIGLGFRYTLRNNLSVAFDYAWQLSERGRFNDYDSRVHLAVQLAY